MADDSFFKILVSFLLLGAFIVMLGTAIIDVSTNETYDVDEARLQEATGGAFTSGTNLSENLSDTTAQAETFRQRFKEGGVDDVDDPSGIFAIINDMVAVVFAPFTVTMSVAENILGIPKVLTGVLLSILVLGIILGAWSVLRSGR